jgi:hypothetical protein
MSLLQASAVLLFPLLLLQPAFGKVASGQEADARMIVESNGMIRGDATQMEESEESMNIFAQYDQDKDGTWSPLEFASFYQSLKLQGMHDEVRQTNTSKEAVNDQVVVGEVGEDASGLMKSEEELKQEMTDCCGGYTQVEKTIAPGTPKERTILTTVCLGGSCPQGKCPDAGQVSCKSR